MLKITIIETATDRRWIVQGRLVGPWVGELRTTWKRAHKSQDKRPCIIDLNDVTLIDKSGERLLRAISKKGAQLIASGVYTKHVLQQLKTGAKHVLITLTACLLTGLQMNVIVPLQRKQAPPRIETRVNNGSGLQFSSGNPQDRSIESGLNASREGKNTMPLEVTDAIGGANGTSSSGDRMARTVEQ
jgi:hypothetical protein